MSIFYILYLIGLQATTYVGLHLHFTYGIVWSYKQSIVLQATEQGNEDHWPDRL